MKVDDYVVFVLCSTYNQSLYIKEALDGFCMQQTNFPFVCGIIDDASTDGEQDVLMRYLEEHFYLNGSYGFQREENDNYIRIFARHKENQNCSFLIVLLKSNHYQHHKDRMVYVAEWKDNAKYNAFCEGDDYWIDPKKLSKQVTILESDEGVGLCYAQAKVYDENTKSFTKEIKGHRFETFEQQLLWNYIPTLTVCMRTDLRKRYEIEKRSWEEAKTWKMGDYPMWLWFCLHGKVSFLDEIVAVYRVTVGTASRPQTLLAQKAFIDSTYSIQMHFAIATNADDRTIELIQRGRDKAMAYMYINGNDYGRGVIEAKQLPLFQYIRVLLYMLKKRLFE